MLSSQSSKDTIKLEQKLGRYLKKRSDINLAVIVICSCVILLVGEAAWAKYTYGMWDWLALFFVLCFGVNLIICLVVKAKIVKLVHALKRTATGEGAEKYRLAGLGIEYQTGTLYLSQV